MLLLTLGTGSENSGRALLVRADQVSQVEEETSEPQRFPRLVYVLNHRSRDPVAPEVSRPPRHPYQVAPSAAERMDRGTEGTSAPVAALLGLCGFSQ